MPGKAQTNMICPICAETILEQVFCSFEACQYGVITCPRCDRRQVVEAFMKDHETDCEHRPVTARVA